ncbi:hypothetical protein GCM10025884_05900 [Leuconostoc gelidum subsp. gelidum]|nr:hypothetical protein GCM10025884_05900 [Leuconostoc gelidum subsp. gelidum]
MDFFNALERTFTNASIVSAITSTVFIILIGYSMRKREVFTDMFAKTLTKVVLSVALPALAFTSFMQPIDPKTLSQSTNVLIWGIVMYVVLIFVMNPFFAMYKTQGDRQMTLKVLSIFGSTTFLGCLSLALYGELKEFYMVQYLTLDIVFFFIHMLILRCPD